MLTTASLRELCLNLPPDPYSTLRS